VLALAALEIADRKRVEINAKKIALENPNPSGAWKFFMGKIKEVEAFKFFMGMIDKLKVRTLG
jgi:hypothetical protein